MIKMRVLAYVIAVFGLVFSGCQKNKDMEERYTWKSDAPMTIPYRVRLQRFDKENLIRNSSFENGRIFKLDSATTSFVIERWQQIGQNVHWVDITQDSLYDKGEVYSGNRAVKIQRKTAYETDSQGDGILSDFIKVIPGNYVLTMYARLEDVKPQMPRLGTRMYDGVDIRLLFYDRNKILIQPGFQFPQARQVINTSFKGLSFANFDAIDSFGWGKVIGKSHHFPFPEGDIPSDAHFVKIFVGLKGTGTLWIDNLSFKYSGQNFSVAERMNRYTDTVFHTPEAFIPTPKNIIKMGAVIFAEQGMPKEQFPVILIGEGDTEIMNAAKIIQSALQKSAGRAVENGNSIPHISITTQISPEQLSSSRLILSIGQTNLYNQYRNKLPVTEIEAHDQGYYIYTPGDMTNLVILGANNSIGLYYAALTSVQMIDKKAPVFHNARIIDYPDFPLRFYTMHSAGRDFHSELTNYKINGAFLLNTSVTDTVDALSKNQSNQNLFQIIPVSGYFPPDDSTLTYRYPLKTSEVTDQTGYIIPPVFHNQILDNSYNTLCCRNEILSKPVYSGSSFFSMNTDKADIERFSAIVGTPPVFMDNSMLIATSWGQYEGSENYYPGKIRLFNIFEPYMNSEIHEFFALLDTSLFVVNLPASSEIEIIRLATAADFLWNTSSYSADYSLWKVLVSRYGIENARDLITYAERYSLLLEVVVKLEMRIQTARNSKTGQQMMTDLTSLLADISANMGTHNRLVKELLFVNAGIRNKLQQNLGTSPVKK
jgi:hypothetical protein